MRWCWHRADVQLYGLINTSPARNTPFCSPSTPHWNYHVLPSAAEADKSTATLLFHQCPWVYAPTSSASVLECERRAVITAGHKARDVYQSSQAHSDGCVYWPAPAEWGLGWRRWGDEGRPLTGRDDIWSIKWCWTDGWSGLWWDLFLFHWILVKIRRELEWSWLKIKGNVMSLGGICLVISAGVRFPLVLSWLARGAED